MSLAWFSEALLLAEFGKAPPASRCTSDQVSSVNSARGTIRRVVPPVSPSWTKTHKQAFHHVERHIGEPVAEGILGCLGQRARDAPPINVGV